MPDFKPDSLNALIPGVKDYLERYGYKAPCTCRRRELCPCCCEGLKKAQRILGETPTGNLDIKVLKAIRRPRCGNPDFPPSVGVMAKVVSGYKWQKHILSWSMLGYTRDIWGKHEVRAFRDALKVWEEALEGKLQFHHFLKAKKKAVEADIVAIFGLKTHKAPDPQKNECPYEFEGELAHAFYPVMQAGYEYLAGNCHFDDAFSWSAKGNPPGGYSFLSVACHELGHCLGLAHNANADSILYPWYNGLEQLSEYDIKAIRELYH